MIRQLYDRFNARDIEGVLTALGPDVAWANGMEGGHEQGREAVRAYWTRQWAIVSPHVEPIAFEHTDDGIVIVEVIQSILNLEEQPLEGQSHDLRDKRVMHIFRIESDKIVRFDIRDDG